jgi:hypothetical protein
MKFLNNFLKALCFFLVVATLSACKPTAATIKTSFTEHKKDSTFTKEVVRYDTVEIAGDSIPYEVRIECDEKTNKPKPVKFKAKSGRATVDMSLDSAGLLKGVAGCDHLIKRLEAKDRYITTLSNTIRDWKFEETKIVIDHKPYWFDKVARVLALIFILLIIFKIVKTFYRI